MKSFYELRFFLILWLTQAFSSLGSAMTNFALVLWLYQDSGSALKTAMLTVCSYAPYVLLSIFAGVISDRWNKKAVMLVCDSIAAAGTLVIVLLLQLHLLAVWHLYLLNACNGLMNAVQSPASDVATTLLTPKKIFRTHSNQQTITNSSGSIFRFRTKHCQQAAQQRGKSNTAVHDAQSDFSLLWQNSCRKGCLMHRSNQIDAG